MTVPKDFPIFQHHSLGIVLVATPAFTRLFETDRKNQISLIADEVLGETQR